MVLERITLSEMSAVIQPEPKPTPTKNSLANFPMRYRGASLDSCLKTPGNCEALKAARAWVSGESENLFLYGPQGTGKTHIACAAMSERPGYPEFISVPVMLLKFQAGVSEHDELELIGQYTGYSGKYSGNQYATPLRLFDDVAAHRISDFGIEMFCILLEKLYSNCSVGNIFTSNLSPKQILETMGERIASRLQGLAQPIKVDGEDWRLKTHV